MGRLGLRSLLLGFYVQHKAVVGDLIAVLFCDLVLQALNLVTDKLDDAPGLYVHHVVMVMALCQLKNRMPSFEMVARDQRRRLKLRQHAINRRQADILARFEQMTVDLLRTQVTRVTRLEDFKDFEARQRDFKSSLAQVLIFQRYLQPDGSMPACAGGALGVLLHAEKITPNAMPKLQRIFLPLFLTTLVVSLASCTIFRLPTIQGNVIEQKQVDQLEIGMSPDQVRFLLGTPLVQGSFDPNRWDYVYYYRSPGGQEVQRSLNLYFEKDKLARIVGQDDPSATGSESTPTTAPEERPVDDTPLPDSSVSPGSDDKESPIPKP